MEKRWSRKHAQCVGCGQSDQRHYGHGLCKSCYQAKWSGEKAEHVSAYKKVWYEESKARVDYREKSRIQKNGRAGAALLRQQGSACQQCGSAERLQIHHQDHRGHNLPPSLRNNEETNLEILCAHCHGRLHGIVVGWSRKYAACLRCGGTERSHHARGYCTRCLSYVVRHTSS